MGVRIDIGGVNQSTSIAADRGVSIDIPHNERATASFTTKPGLVPALGAEVLIYDKDETTALFGGLVFQRASQGAARHLFTLCECTDWTWYLDHLTVAGGSLTGTITLKQVLEWLQATYFAAYGFTLDGAQVTGPSATVTGFQWERKYASDVLRDLTTWSGGYVFKVSPTKVWKMEKPAMAATAPFTITDANSNARVLEWQESRENYATRIIGKVGGTGTRATTQTWTVTSGIIAAGYVQTDAPSTPTGGVSATINGVAATVGPSGTQLLWDWETHRLTAGTYAPTIGDVIALTYTAQYPFEVVADAGVSPPIERTMDFEDLTDVATATAMVNGALTQAYQTPRVFDIDTKNDGLRPGQVVSINSTYRASASLLALVTRVSIQFQTNTLWIYRATATTGVYQGSGLDFWRSLGSGGGVNAPSLSVTYTPGINPETGAGGVASLPAFAGGSRAQYNTPTADTWTEIPEYVDLEPLVSGSYTFRGQLWTEAATTTTKLRVWNVTTSAQTGSDSSTVSGTTPTTVTLSATLTAGNIYRLQHSYTSSLSPEPDGLPIYAGPFTAKLL